MRAYQFITEAPVKPYETELSTIVESVATIKEHCSQAIPMLINNKPLWRGMNNHSEKILQIWPETGERKSQNTSNYYTQILANSPLLSGFPKRNKSVICSTSSDTARGFAGGAWGGGGLYAIIPYDHVEIGICPTSDLWDINVTIPELEIYGKSMTYLNEKLYQFDLAENFRTMQQQLNNPTSIPYQKVAAFFARNRFGRADQYTPEQLIPALFKALSPENLGLQLMNVSEFAANPPERKECWVSGPCVAIHSDYFADVRVQFMPGTPR